MGSESTYAVLVRDLRELLGLDEPPIGIAFVEEKPDGV
jgi:hypothetical protein